MTRSKRNQPGNDALQSSEVDRGLGQDERAFGAGGQRDQNRGHQQRQQHDVNRDASLGMAGASATTENRGGGPGKRR
jgi:hypothetical protein